MSTDFLPAPFWFRPTPFHIEHGTKPGVVHEILRDPAGARQRLNISEISWSKITPFVKQLGILDDQYVLTAFGERLARETEDVVDVAEAISAWFLSAFTLSRNYRFSFAFRRVVAHLTETAGSPITAALRITVVEETRVEASSEYALALEQVAFSQNSLNGVFFWLSSLSPTPLMLERTTQIFQLRPTCRPVGTLYALRLIAALNGGSGALEDNGGLHRQLADRLLLSGPDAAQEAIANLLRLRPKLAILVDGRIILRP